MKKLKIAVAVVLSLISITLLAGWTTHTFAPISFGTLAGRPNACVANEELYVQTNSNAGLYTCNSLGTGWNNVTNTVVATDPWCDVRAYGASNTATPSANTAAFISCVSALPSGSTILVPSVVLPMNPLAFTRLREYIFKGVSADQGESGAGTRGAVLKYDSSAPPGGTMFQVKGGNGVYLRDIALDCNLRAAVGLDLEADATNGALGWSGAENVPVMNCTGDYIKIGSPDNTGINDITLEKVQTSTAATTGGRIHTYGNQTVDIWLRNIGTAVFAENGQISIDGQDGNCNTPNGPCLEIGANNILTVSGTHLSYEASDTAIKADNPGGGTYISSVTLSDLRISWNPSVDGKRIFDIQRSGYYFLNGTLNTPSHTGSIYIHPNGNLPATLSMFMWGLNFPVGSSLITEDYDCTKVNGMEVWNDGTVRYPCGTALMTNSSTNTDLAGQCTIGVNCSIGFSHTYVTAPICTATDTTAAAVGASTSTTTLTITGTGGHTVNYTCIGRT